MNFSKTLTTAIAATTIVGAVGLVYAQTSSDTSAAPINPTTAATDPAADSQKPATESPQGSQSQPGSSTDMSSPVTPTPAPAENNSTLASEPAPKADRN